ncbi:hypothetical protein [Sphingobacterium tabacisoli]|uniref:Lipoprotein n=1 Tax=Sphingobacterium tabacisoli TaxID=2044855 RepID=A0ABW5L0P8_9SPHI|nr:hypothetical protein [Sphingobacterium tabacisoli]
MHIRIKLLFSVIIAIFVGCSSDGKNAGVDLAEIIGRPETKDIEAAASRTSDQKGHYEVGDSQFHLVDNGEVVRNYSFDEKEADQLRFDGLEINALYGAKVISYDNSIAFVSLKAPEKNVAEYFKTFVKTLGKPDSIQVQDVLVETLNKRVQTTILEAFPGTAKVYKNEFNSEVLDYPQRLFWKKGDLRYFLSLDPVGDNVNLAIDIITEKALHDCIVMGYHVPQ